MRLKADIVVFAALGWERRAVLAGAGRHNWVCTGGRLWQAVIESSEGERRRVVVVESGPGLAAARRAAVAAPNAAWFVVIGTAGGLEPSLGAGDLVVAERLILAPSAGAGRREYRCDGATRGLVALAQAGGLRVFAGPVLSSAAPLVTVQEKARASREAIAVEMEGAAVAEVAASRGARVACVRAVLDGARDELVEAGKLVDETGFVRPLAALALLARPAVWPRLLRLGRQARLARRTLAAFSALLFSTSGLGVLAAEAPRPVMLSGDALV